MTLRWPLTPHMLMSHVRLHPRIIVSNSHGNTSKYVNAVTIFQKLNEKVNDPKMTFDPTSVEVTCVTLSKDHRIQVPWKYINVFGYSDYFSKSLPKRSMTQMTPRWPLTSLLLKSHVQLYPRIIVSNSHENKSKHVDTVTLFWKTLTEGQWLLDDLWPPLLLRSHVWLYPRIIVSKSHGNISMYVDTVINFETYHIVHTTYGHAYVH